MGGGQDNIHIILWHDMGGRGERRKTLSVKNRGEGETYSPKEVIHQLLANYFSYKNYPLAYTTTIIIIIRSYIHTCTRTSMYV